jgi:hypothetical protein
MPGKFVKLQPQGQSFALFVPRRFYRFFRALINLQSHPIDVRPADGRNNILTDEAGRRFQLSYIVSVCIARQVEGGGQQCDGSPKTDCGR